MLWVISDQKLLKFDETSTAVDRAFYGFAVFKIYSTSIDTT